jgi:hypothetical protein
VGGPKRYVPDLLRFPSPIRTLPHLLLRATLRHHCESTAPTSTFQRRAVSEVCQLIFSLQRCRAGALCATSRRNNLSITPEHGTSCVPLHRRPVAFSSGTVSPSEKSRGHIAAASTRVFGCTTERPLLGRQAFRATLRVPL